MNIEQMVAEFAAYESTERDVQQHARLLERMLQSGGEQVAQSFHDRTIARLASTREPLALPEAPAEAPGAPTQSE